MSVARIGETQAKPETTQALRDFLISIMPGIKSSLGCESVTLYQSQADSTRFTIIEIWDSIESHHASVKNIRLKCWLKSDRCWRPRQAVAIMM